MKFAESKKKSVQLNERINKLQCRNNFKTGGKHWAHFELFDGIYYIKN